MKIIHPGTLGRHAVQMRSGTNVTAIFVEGLTNPALTRRMIARLETMQTNGLISPASVEVKYSGDPMPAVETIQVENSIPANNYGVGMLDRRINSALDFLHTDSVSLTHGTP